jgi:hypothetical protein
MSDETKMRNVLIAAPSYDGRVNVWHAAALSETCKIGLTRGVNVRVVYMSYDALVQRARNDIFKLAYDSNVNDLVFIDCDVDWRPEDFFRLLDHDVAVVAAPIIKKTDNELNYSVKALDGLNVEENGLVAVDGVATGFMRVRADAISRIWNASEEYQERHKSEPSRMVFEVKVVDGELWAEDIIFCHKWTEMGEKVYIDPTINCGHSGEKRWVSNFGEYMKVLNNSYDS